MKTQQIASFLMAALTASTLSMFFAASAFADPPEEVHLNRLLIARQVEDREPSDTEGNFYADGERLYVFVDVYNRTDPDLTVTVVWHRVDTGREFSTELEVGESRRWRTWAYHRMSESQAGQWQVSIIDNQGRELGSVEFEVLPIETDLSEAVAESR